MSARTWLYTEWVHRRRAGRFPVRVFVGVGLTIARPESVGGALNGCFASGTTVDEAIDNLTALLPAVLRHRRSLGLGTPRPVAAVTLKAITLRLSSTEATCQGC